MADHQQTTPLPEEDPQASSAPQRERRRRRWNRMRRVIIYGISLILGLILLFQVPAFQNWIGKRVVKSISNTLGTEVSLKRVNLSWLDALSIDGLYVEDKYGDTLLYSQSITADFNFNPVVLFSRGLEIEALNISNTRFVIRRDVGDVESNLETALGKLFPPKETAAKPLNLNLKRLTLESIHFVQADSVRGQRMDLDLREAMVRLDDLNLPGKEIRLSDVSIYEPNYRLTNFAPSPLSEDALSKETIDMIDSISASVGTANPASLRFTVDRINIVDGQFKLDNFRKDPIEYADITAIDFARLGVSEINLEVNDLAYQRDTFTGQLLHLSLKETSGFVVDKLSVQELLVAPTRLIANDIELLTPNSRISDTLDFSYRRGWTDWNDFPNRVNMRLDFDDSRIAFRDVMYFARKLRNNQFFRDNRTRDIRLDGLISGRVNSLKGNDLQLALDRNNSLSGNFALTGITRPGEQFLELDLDQANTNMNSLRRLITGFNPPPAFDRLGTLNFSGRFDGFLTNFVASGDLRTDIGQTELNMQMNLIPGVAAAEYRGGLQLSNFDLGIFLGKQEFGLVSLSGNIENGRGLVAETASASLTAVIDDFTFRDYTYRQAEISGQLNRNFFDGSFNIKDENIDFNFLGELDFRDSIANFDFSAEVARLDLKALNLGKADLVLSGLIDLNLINTRFSEMEGNLDIGDLRLIKDGSDVYDIDTVSAYSTFDEIGRKVVVLESDVATGKLVGAFDIDQVVGSLKQFMINNYPGFANRLNLSPPRRLTGGNSFSYQLNILDSKGLNYLIAPTLGPIKGLAIAGSYDEAKEELGIELEIPQLEIGKLRINDLIMIASSDGPLGEISLVVDSTYNNGKPLLGQLTFLSLLTGDSLQFGINYASEASSLLDKIDLDGLFYLPDSVNYRISFDSSRVVLFQDIWEISGENSITFRKGYVDTRNLSLTSGRRIIRLQPEGRRGLGLDLRNFELALIDSLWDYQQLDFSGDFDAKITVNDIFKLEGLSANLRSDTFLMNGDDYGWMRLDATTPNIRGQVAAYMSLNRDTSQLITEAIFNLQDLVDQPTRDAERKNYLALDVAINGYPLELANYWVGGAVSGLEGQFNAGMEVKGLTRKLNVDGFIQATNGAFTIDYLKTRYRFNESRVEINNNLFDASGTILYDRFGNTARVSGGISHQRLKNLGLAAELYTDRFLALDLSKEDNDLFYGRAVGKGRIAFSGDFKQTDIYVRAEVGEQSYLYIPTDQTATSGPISDIRFVNKKVYVEPEEESTGDLTGVSLEMEIIVNEQAQVEIVFDEEIGDLIRGNGRGNLRITLPRDGEMQIFGDYNIVGGNYLFTFYKVVNKLFSVRPGGQIVWSGDPFGAQINLKADYEKLSTPIANFIQEYLLTTGNDDLKSAASRATEVDLTLILQGQLLQPDINFDLSFPELDGQLETFANNKRRLLLLDQNELNRQVFGLIVVGQFLPADLSFSTQDVAVNTLSEWVSNYFSVLLNNLLTDTFGEEAFISSFDFDLAYNRYNNGSLNTNGLNSRGDVFEFTIRKDLGDRWTVATDFSVLSNNQLAAGGASRTFIGNDFALEYAFNDKRTLKLRFYQRRSPDIVSAARNQVGLGLSWRKEFNSLSEFFGKMKEEAQ